MVMAHETEFKWTIRKNGDWLTASALTGVGSVAKSREISW